MTDATRRLYEEGRKFRLELRSHGHYLIVEDSRDTINLFKALFCQCKTKLEAVTSVEAAIAHIEENEAELQCVVIDMNLPDNEGVGGYRVVEHLENMRKGIPYIVHTADHALANKLIKEYPRASVFLKGAALTEIRSLLGLNDENKNKD